MFQFVKMPEYILPFLKCNMQSGSDNLVLLYDKIITDQAFFGLFSKYFEEFDVNLEPKRVISALGWESFRNRFCSLYCYYLKNGKYPNSCNELDMALVIDFEKKFRMYSVEGHGRVFLFAMYLFYLDLGDNGNRLLSALENTHLFQLLGKTRIKELRIDWLFLALIFFLEHFSAEEIINSFSEEESYLSLYRQLDETKQSQLVSAYLSYGASIQDDYFFINSVFEEK